MAAQGGELVGCACLDVRGPAAAAEALAAATTAVYPPESAVIAFSTPVPIPCPSPPARTAGAEWRRRMPRCR